MKDKIGKSIMVIFDSGMSHPMKKEGILLDVNETHPYIENSINGRREYILRSKCIRIEFNEVEK